MGAHMAARLIDAGHALAVFDTRAEAMVPHVARGALACDIARRGGRRGRHRARQPADARRRARGRRRAAGRRTPCGPTSTSRRRGPRWRRRSRRRCATRGVACLDAPVSGGVAGAQAGTLTIMAAGEQELFERLRPVLEVLGAQRRARRAPSPARGSWRRSSTTCCRPARSRSPARRSRSACTAGCPRARCSTSSTPAAGATRRAPTSSPSTCCRGPSPPASASS